MDLGHYLLILVSTVLVNTVVLVRVLGLCPFMGVSKKLEAAIGMGAATTFVLTLAAGSSHLVNQLLIAANLEFLRTLSFIVIIAGIVQFTEMVIHKNQPGAVPGAGHLLALDHHQLRRTGHSAAQRPAAAQFCRVAGIRLWQRAGL